VHKYNYEPCIYIKINKTKYNHPKGRQPWDDCKTRSGLAQQMKDLGDIKDEHDFCEESERNFMLME
jgi:hypothetical protein